MKKQVISSETEVNSRNIKEWIQLFDNIQQHLLKLERIYEAQDIIDKGTQRCDGNRPNNKVHSNLASMIVKNSTNYFIGKPCTYSFTDKGIKKDLEQYLFDSRENQ